LFLGGAGWLAGLFAPAGASPAQFNYYEAIVKAFNPAMLGLGGSLCPFLIGYLAGQVRPGLRDRLLGLLVLGAFVMVLSLAAEQAGNVLNIWADKNTDRYLTQPMKPEKWETVDVSETGVEEEKTETSEEPSSQSMATRVKERFLNMFRLKPAPVEKPEPRPA